MANKVTPHDIVKTQIDLFNLKDQINELCNVLRHDKNYGNEYEGFRKFANKTLSWAEKCVDHEQTLCRY